MADPPPDPTARGDSAAGALDEVTRLRDERDALAREVQALRSTPRRWWQPVAVGVLVVVAWVALALAPVAVWSRAQVLETDRWVAVAGPLSREPAVRAALADWATEELAALVRPEEVLRRALPDRAEVLAVPLAGAVTAFVHDQVSEYLATEEFSELWDRAVVRAHTAALGLLEGDAPNVEAGATSVTINLLPLLQRVLDRILAAIPDLFGHTIALPGVDLANIPPGTAQALGRAVGVEVPEDLGQITVYDRGRLRAAQDGLQALGRLVGLVVVVAVVAPLVALGVSRARRRTGAQLLVGTMVGVVLARAGVLAVTERITGRIDGAPARGVAERLGDRLLAPFLDGTGAMVVVGLVGLVVLFLTGGHPGAVRVRAIAAGALRRAGAGLPGDAGPRDRGPGRPLTRTGPERGVGVLGWPTVPPPGGLRPEEPPMAPSPASGIDVAELDPGARPQDDLFAHVNGRWLAATEIPSDRAAHGAFHMLHDQSEIDVRAILVGAAAGDAAPGTAERKVGDLWAAFMDVEEVERRDAEPLADDLAQIRQVSTVEAFTALLGRLERHGTPGLVGWFVDNDGDDATRYVVNLVQGGIGLPDEAYYREEAHAETRAAYVEHIATVLRSVDEPDAAGAAEQVMALETALAAAHWTTVDSRDAIKTHNKRDRTALEEATPGFDWAGWLDGLAAPEAAFAVVVVRQPSAIEAAARLLGEVPLAHWKAWLVFHHVRAAAPYLSSRLVEANFAFYGTLLSGIPEVRERWKRGVQVVEAAMGEAVGQLYVDRHFPPEYKAHMDRLVGWLVEAYRSRISTLAWMSPATRERALDKLDRFTPKVGYPATWRDYSALAIDRSDLLGSVRRAAAFESDRNLAKIGRPIDRDEWHMTPQTVNAYYNPGMNEIVFPAAILRWPFFDPTADDAVNFGGIGAVIGHEIGHGFDDQGSRYDGDGNLADWWTDEDRERFDVLTQALIAQYDTFELEGLEDHRVNGALTVGENIGDLGGIGIAHEAYRLSLEGAEAPVIDGLTGSQRVFLGWAQVWRTVTRREERIRRLAIDPHSPPELRANVVRNLDEFHDAFAVARGDGMWVPEEERVRIW